MEIKQIAVDKARQIIETRTPHGLFWCRENDTYIGIDNHDGNAWTEEFTDFNKLTAWLNGSELEDLQGERPMKRFENVNIIEALRKIMLHNTHHFQEDFEYDIRMLQNAASSTRSGETFLWMSKHIGTWLFSERDVHIFQSPAHITWQGYIPDYDGVKAFWIELDQPRDGNIYGNICELDYASHKDNLRKNSVAANEVLVTFRNSPYPRSFEPSEYAGHRESIKNRYGETGHVEYQVRDEQEFRSNLKRLARDFWQAAEPADIDEYIRDMVDERFKSIGYTEKDMAYLSETDAFDALKHQIPVWLLSENNGKEEIKTEDDVQHHISRDAVFGIGKDHRHLLDYLKTHPNIESGLFSHDELKKIMFLSIIAGQDVKTSPDGSKTLQSILYKLDKVFCAPAPEHESSRGHTLVSDMEDMAAEDEMEP